ncbi:hypothetical protein ABPG74_005036 [Tetrahymena malaccensis]
MQTKKEANSILQKQNSVIQFCNQQDHLKENLEEENFKESQQFNAENQNQKSEYEYQSTPKNSHNMNKKNIKWINSCKGTQERQKLNKQNTINSQFNRNQQDQPQSFNSRVRKSVYNKENNQQDSKIEKENELSEINNMDKKSIDLMQVQAENQTPTVQQKDEKISGQHFCNFEIDEGSYVMFSLFFFSKDNIIRIFCNRFLNSRFQAYVEIAFTITNVIALMLTDYSFRVNGNSYLEYGLNQAKYILEIVSNSVFSLLALTKIISVGFILGKNTFMTQKWNIFDLLILSSSWVSIEYNDIEILNIVKIFRVLFFVRTNYYLQHQVDCFVVGFKELWKPFIPFFSVVLLYSVMGLYFFNGLLESKCRETPDPELDPYSWPILEDNPFLCGYISCPANSYCRNPSDYNLPEIPQDNNYIELFYGFTNFDTIWQSIYTVQSFFTVNGWSTVTEIYQRAQNKTVSQIYFGSLVLLLAHIFGNMVLATLHESFMEHHSISQNESDSNKMMRNLDLKMLLKKDMTMQRKFTQVRQSHVGLKKKKTFFNKILSESAQNLNQRENQKLKKTNFYSQAKNTIKSIQKSTIYITLRHTNICLQIIVLSLDRVSIKDDQLRNLYLIDFITTLILFLEIPIELISSGWKKYWKDQLNKLDLCIVLAHIIMYCIEANNQIDLFFATNQYSIFIRTTKILRIYRLIYTLSIFQSIKIILKTYSKTLKMITGYFIVILILITLYALIGRELFSQRVQYDTMMINFNSLSDSFIAVILFCFDEEWHIVMYQYYNQIGYRSFIYCLFCTYTCSVIMVSLFIAIFINNFMDWLRFFEDQIYTSSPFINRVFKFASQLYSRLQQFFLQNDSQNILNQNIDLKKSQINQIQPVEDYLSKVASQQNFIKEDEALSHSMQNIKKNSKFININSIANHKSEFEEYRKFPISKPNYQQISVLPVIYQKATNQTNHQSEKALSIFNRNNTNLQITSPQNQITEGQLENIQKEKIIEFANKDTQSNLYQIEEQDFQKIITPVNYEHKEQKSQFLNKQTDKQLTSSEKLEQKQNSQSLKNESIQNQSQKSSQNIQNKGDELGILQNIQNVNIKKKDDLKNQEENSESDSSSQQSKESQLQKNNTEANKQAEICIKEGSAKQCSFFIFSYSNTFRIYCKKIADHSLFYKLKIFLLLFFALVLGILDPYLDIYSSFGYFLTWADFCMMILFSIQTFIYSIAYGPLLFLGNNQFNLNINNALEIVFNICHLLYFLPFSNQSIYALRIFKIFRLLLLLPFLQNNFGSINFAVRVCKACLPRMFKIMIFGIIFAFINSVFVTKLLKAQMNFCQYDENSLVDFQVQTDKDCMDIGGDWVEYKYQFNNVFSSIAVLLMVQTSEGWTQIMEQQFNYTSPNTQPKETHQSFWILFYIQFYCIANFCILNMFVGVVVDTFKELKENEAKLDKLTPQQKEWYYIKYSIYNLEISKKINPPENKISQLIYETLEHKKYLKYIFNFFTVFNCVSILGYTHRQEDQTLQILNYINLCCIITFVIELILNLISLRKNYFEKKWNRFNILMIIMAIINNYFQMTINYKSYDYFYKIFGGIAWSFQLLKVYSILVHLKVMKKLLNSFFGAVSSIFGLSTLVFLFLYVSVLLAMNLFPYIKNQSVIDDYDTNFNSFMMSLLTLIRISTSEMWFPIIAECAAQQSSVFVCRSDIYTYDDYLKYGKNSCGSNLSYFFFNIYYFVFTLFILNLLIASIILSYKEGYIQEESAINIYQLDDIKKLWSNFDPEGYGFINYKLFWQFSSQIAYIFGIKQEDLLDVSLKKKFLERLNIPMFEDPYNKTLVYKFHDVIIKLAEISLKIKYQIENLEPDNKDIKRYHKSILLRQEKIKNVQYYQKSMFRSRDMVVIITIIRKIKEWKKRYLEKDKDYQIFDIKNLTKRLQVFKQQEIQSQLSNQIKETQKSESHIKQNDDNLIQNTEQQQPLHQISKQQDQALLIFKEKFQAEPISPARRASENTKTPQSILTTTFDNQTQNNPFLEQQIIHPDNQHLQTEIKYEKTEESMEKNSSSIQILAANNRIFRKSSIFKKEQRGFQQQEEKEEFNTSIKNIQNKTRNSQQYQENAFINNIKQITIENYDDEAYDQNDDEEIN